MLNLPLCGDVSSPDFWQTPPRLRRSSNADPSDLRPSQSSIARDPSFTSPLLNPREISHQEAKSSLTQRLGRMSIRYLTSGMKLDLDFIVIWFAITYFTGLSVTYLIGVYVIYLMGGYIFILSMLRGPRTVKIPTRVWFKLLNDISLTKGRWRKSYAKHQSKSFAARFGLWLGTIGMFLARCIFSVASSTRLSSVTACKYILLVLILVLYLSGKSLINHPRKRTRIRDDEEALEPERLNPIGLYFEQISKVIFNNHMGISIVVLSCLFQIGLSPRPL